MKRIVFLSIFFAALIEFAIERARFDLWIVAVVAIVTLPGTSREGRFALIWTRRSPTTMSPFPEDSRHVDECLST